MSGRFYQEYFPAGGGDHPSISVVGDLYLKSKKKSRKYGVKLIDSAKSCSHFKISPLGNLEKPNKEKTSYGAVSY